MNAPLPALKEVIARYGLSAKKHWGKTLFWIQTCWIKSYAVPNSAIPSRLTAEQSSKSAPVRAA